MDAFALLGLPRQAALHLESLEKAYFGASKLSPESAELHAAYETLQHAEKRLRHLLDLAAPPEAKAWRAVKMEEDLMAIFLRLGQARTQAAGLIAKRSTTSSGLAKALQERQLLASRDELEQIGEALEERRGALESALPALEGDWLALAAAQAQFSYLAKWQQQVRELLLAMM
jgi:exonuclease VII small subunit